MWIFENIYMDHVLTQVLALAIMGTHSSVLAWRIPGTEEPGGLLSMGLHRVGHDWSNLAAAAAVYLCCQWNLGKLVRILEKFFSFIKRCV